MALAGLAMMFAGATSATAQKDEAEPLVLSVTPSGVDAPVGDLDALLERRMRRSDFLFRSICRGCGNSERFSGAAPFDPLGALAAKRKVPTE